MDDGALLRIEMDTIWAHDARGRMTHVLGEPSRPAPLLAVGLADGAVLADARFDVDDALATEASALVRTIAPAREHRLRDDTIARLSALLEPAFGAIAFDGGIGYVLPDDVAYDSGAPLVTSASPEDARTRLVAPAEANWREDEWRALTTNRLGPWAMALDTDGGVISICHCARLTDIAAEAGVWTHPDHRGRRHAVAVTAAWATLLQPMIPHRFYSHATENAASQRVAERLGARRIGCVWRWDAAAG